MFKKLKFVIGCCFFIFSCERAVVDSKVGKIVVAIPQLNSITKTISDFTTFSQGTSPATWNEVDCVGFMVSGPEAALSQNSCKLLNGQTGAQVRVFKFGAIHAGYYTGENAEFDVPAGPDRIITAVGFKTNITAANGAASACKKILIEEKESFSKAFIFATSEKFNVFGGTTQTVNLPINYIANLTPFFGDCSGPTAPGGNGSTPAGPPVKIQMRIQDNMTTGNRDACLIVAFELIDANGNLAAVTEDFDFDIHETFSSGLKFGPAAPSYCDSGLGYNYSLQFHGLGGRYSRVVGSMYLQNASSYSFVLTKTAGSALAIDVPPSFTVLPSTIPSTDPPFKLSIFDVRSFRSVGTTSVANPIETQTNQCNPAIVQILDAYGLPVQVTNSGPGPGGTFFTSTVSANSFEGAGVFFTLDDTCASGLTPTNSFSLDYLVPALTGMHKFYYTANAAAAGKNFTIKAMTSGPGYFSSGNSITNVDVSAVSNNRSFWKFKN